MTKTGKAARRTLAWTWKDMKGEIKEWENLTRTFFPIKWKDFHVSDATLWRAGLYLVNQYVFNEGPKLRDRTCSNGNRKKLNTELVAVRRV
jgi:hypothetical protein